MIKKSFSNSIKLSIRLLMHTVIVKENDDVLVFGCNDNGQLGLGHNDDQNKPITLMRGIPIRQIACGYRHTVSLRAKAQTNLPLRTRW